MRLMIAGATGAIGRPLIRCLRERSHAVFALARSPESARAVAAAVAEPVIADALDAAAVKAALIQVRPEAVINELTSLPRHYTAAEMAAAAERDRKVRTEGNANLLAALRARVVVDEVIGARCAVERGGGRCRRILDMHPIPHTLAFADHWNLSPANLVTDIAVGGEPGAGAVEEAVAKSDEVNARARLQLGIATRAGGDRRRGRVGERLSLVGKALARRVPEP